MKYQMNLKGVTPDMLLGFFVDWPNPPNVNTHYSLLKNSTKFILAFDEEKQRVVGFITAISDGLLSAYIPFLEVLPEYQKNGIGSELVRRMLEELDDLYMVDLMCDENLQTFYTRFNMFKSEGMIKRNYHQQAGKT
ncbi:GNAT family N-acetyltransferase [Evansella cellulosilytica]|uniref:GCN5-related N-acetyltransferase n=1 Tax=Evansella cellulosilytica (strain ATCC 21833 / DSM 2522 / FERM P-1141 / JCM 9156 / N-4) TaxID=649639 RepID=E6TYH3_EVAC2|nr:GNAT family N-acetyltransferase [Evansella cellulosilytica]ADU28911.1 GCN5-related N-acetyltransferase [Evansella cellulosilytica DSM 2522]